MSLQWELSESKKQRTRKAIEYVNAQRSKGILLTGTQLLKACGLLLLTWLVLVGLFVWRNGFRWGIWQ